VVLKGAGEKPIATKEGDPLAGWWDEPTTAGGRGRDVSVVVSYKPKP
jgi:hypothetical protein